jgi:hypothetical protein
MTTLTHTATVFLHYEQTAETRRRTSWTVWCTFRIITNTIRVLLREPRSKYYSASTQASSPRHHTSLREIFFRTPIGLGAPESITVKSTARDAPRRSAGQSLRRSPRAATPRLRLCGGCRTLAWIPSSFVASISRRSAGGSSVRSGISQGNHAISSLAPYDFCASMLLCNSSRRFLGCPGQAVALERMRDPARTPRRDAGYRNM